MTVGSFLCDKMAIVLHKKPCKYSFMTLICQAEDDLFILVGLTLGLGLGIELGQTPIS